METPPFYVTLVITIATIGLYQVGKPCKMTQGHFFFLDMHISYIYLLSIHRCTKCILSGWAYT